MNTLMKEVYVLGFNHNLMSLSDRGKVSIDDEIKLRIYEDCKKNDVQNVCILNTCNRTEIYGYGDITQIRDIFFNHIKEGKNLKDKLNCLSGKAATHHLFKVASGLDSQIVGDFEILEQFKSAFKNAKQQDMLNGYFERLANTCLQAAKEIRNSTRLSSGTISLSYAIINLLKDLGTSKLDQVLVIGLGELGRSISKNMNSYFPDNKLTITNRTTQKSIDLAKELKCDYIEYTDIQNQLDKFDIIVTVVSNLEAPIITHPNINSNKKKVLIDLSVPIAIDSQLGDREEISFYCLDQVSSTINKTLEERKEYIPQAENIIYKHMHEFLEWTNLYAKRGSITKWKGMVEEVSRKCPHFAKMEEEAKNSFLKKSVAKFAVFVKENKNEYNNQKLIDTYLDGTNEICSNGECSNPKGNGSLGCNSCTKTIRIGTRSSKLALWQANFIADKLKKNGINSEIIHIDSEGELDLQSPLYEMGIQGIFTKTLDIALLQNKIDIAVHSLKDVPTQLPKGLTIIATPERGNSYDSLVYKDNQKCPDFCASYTIATSSLRRKAQWLNRFPSHNIELIRGNINTRLDKLNNNKNWDGVLFASAGIERINLDVPNTMELNWMVPAPSQGALAVVCRDEDFESKDICKALDHEITRITTFAERQFLRTLMGGCTMPIAALAKIENGRILFEGMVLTIDGLSKAEILLDLPLSEREDIGKRAANLLLENGGKAIVDTFKNL